MREKEELKLSSECKAQLFEAEVRNKLEESRKDINGAFRKIRELECNKVDKKVVAYVASAITLLMLFLNFIKGFK